MLIRNARVIDPKTQRDEKLDIRISGSVIEEIKPGMEPLPDEQVIEAEGYIAAPGLIDVHVHFRDPGFTYKEDITTGAKAAAQGGFTTVVCMANAKPAVDNIETMQEVLQKGKQTAIHIESAASVTKELNGSELTDMEALVKAGAAGFTDDGFPIMDEKLLYKAFQKAKELNMPVSLHEENPAFIGTPGVNEGAVSAKMGLTGASALAEDIMVARDCMLALHTGAKVNIQHISSAASVDLVRNAKKMGANIYAEATPHHFTLTEEAVLEHGTLAKMNPPLRTEKDREAIIQGLRDGAIDIIATDHAPHSQEEKEKEFANAPSGIIGLETALSLGITSLVEPGHLTMMELIEKMSYNPATLYSFDKGYLAEGKIADIVLFNPTESYEVKEYASKSSNSPFTGRTLKGKVKCTICEGKIAYKS